MKCAFKRINIEVELKSTTVFSSTRSEGGVIQHDHTGGYILLVV